MSVQTLLRAEAARPVIRTDLVLRLIAVGCAVVAGVTHLVVVPRHLEEWPAAGVFFVVVATAQLALAWVLRRPTGPLVVPVALVGTVGLVLLYVATRTVDLPFVPSAHEVSHLPVARGIGNGVPVFPGDRIEEVGVPDLVCLGAELLLVVALCGLGGAATRRRTTTGLCALGALMLALRLTGLLG